VPRKAVAHKQEYEVAEGPIRLTVVVGDRQYGSSMVFLDQELITNGDIDELPLGTGAELAGRTATVYTLVTDIREKKNEMSVTWILTGGRKKLIAEKTGAATKRSGSQMFKAELHFTTAE